MESMEVTPTLFLRKQSNLGCASVRNVQPSKSQVSLGQRSCGNTQQGPAALPFPRTSQNSDETLPVEMGLGTLT